MSAAPCAPSVTGCLRRAPPNFAKMTKRAAHQQVIEAFAPLNDPLPI